jgi:hypothetical protein
MNRKTFISKKTGIIFGAVLLSLIIAFVPTTSAGFINISPLINVSYPAQEENVIPNSGVIQIPLDTIFTLTGPFAGFAEKGRLGKSVVQIELKIVQKPDYCTASISNPLGNIQVGEATPYRSYLTATVTENAPAFQQAVVRISATSKIQRGILFNIAEETTEFDVSFNIGYWSVVSYEMSNGTLAEIGPSDTVDFPINIVNLGNGPTKIEIELMDYPEKEWDINITSSVHLSSGINDHKNNREMVHLKIKPKNSKNWNNKIETFGVRFSPSYLGRPEFQGQQEIINFNVKKISREDEGGNIENNYLIILIVVIVLIILISIFIKRRYLLYTK